TGRVEPARARPAGARAGRSRPARARAAGPAVVEPETVEAVETGTGHNDVTVPTVRLVDSVDSAESAESVSTDTAGIDRNHRAAGPVLGAQPTVPSGGRSAAALASVASRIDTPATLVWQRVRRGIHHEAVLNAEGIITLSNGMRFRDPSAAANAAQHTQDIDGWRVWRIGAQGPALRDFIEG
ncbi:restriction system modified-DNA reader domain-containing protein, partial [Actinomyces gerencseriae]